VETFTARPLAAIAAANKTVYWSFIVTDALANVYKWSTGTIPATVGGTEPWEEAHSFKIVNFSGITLRRNKSESGIHAANDASFTIVNSGNALTAANFKGGEVLINLLINDGIGKELCGSWRFRIKSASPYAQQIDVECEDFVQEFLKGSYPNTPLVNGIFPATQGTANDNICVPEPYGVCYIPLRSVYAGADRHYLLGLASHAYTIEEVRSPRILGTKIAWANPPFTFQQSTVADADAVDWRMFQPLIAGGNPGIFLSGSQILDVPTKFSRDDTVAMTNPADVLHRVLNNMGLVDAVLDLTAFAAAASTFYYWGTPEGFYGDTVVDGFLTDDPPVGSDGFAFWWGGTQSPIDWNFAFWYKQDRTKVLSSLLAMCHACLIVGEKVRLQVLSKTSQATFTKAQVLKGAEVGADSFRYTDSLQEKSSDCGYVAFQIGGEAQDEFLKILVPAKATKNVIDAEVITFPGVSDNQQAQILGTLYYQRKLLKVADLSFTSKGTMVALRPDDIVTINDAEYGGTYDVLIEEMSISPDLSIGFSMTRFSDA